MKIQKPGAKKSAPKMMAGEMTGKMYKKSEIDGIGKKQAAELDKSGVFGKSAMAKKKAKMEMGGTMMKNGGKKKFPDLNKDGKVTKADILKGRGVIAKSGMKMKKQAAIAIAMKKAGKAPKKAMSGYGVDMTPGAMKMGGKAMSGMMMKSGGKKKMMAGGKCKNGC